MPMRLSLRSVLWLAFLAVFFATPLVREFGLVPGALAGVVVGGLVWLAAAAMLAEQPPLHAGEAPASAKTRERAETSLSVDFDTAFDRCLAAIRAVPDLTEVASDRAKGWISAEKRMNWKSIDHLVVVRIKAIDPGHVRVEVESGPMLPMMFTDGETFRANVDKILDILQPPHTRKLLRPAGASDALLRPVADSGSTDPDVLVRPTNAALPHERNTHPNA